MEVALLILAIILLAAGIIFSVLPPLPGPLLSYMAMWAVHLSAPDNEFRSFWLITLGVVTVIILVIDYIMPAAATKKFGGTKAGIWGGLIGTVVGVFSGIPFGILLGPLLGAIIGDLIGGNQFRAALKSGFGSFVGFLVATFMKVVFSIVLGVFIIFNIGARVAQYVMGLF